MKNPEYQDAHLHIANGHPLKISPEIGRIFLNSTSTEDFATVESAASASIIPFFGIHPWFVTDKPVSTVPLEAEIQKIKTSAVGECGLDFSGDYKIYKKYQIEVLESQITLARKYKRPITFHSVRSLSHLIEILKRHSPLNAPFIIHSFYGSKETLNILLELGAYISISNLSLRNPEKSHSVINTIPSERLLIESDIFIGGDEYTIDKHLKILENNYKTVSEIKSISLDNLKEMVWNNGTIFTDRKTSRNREA